MKSLITWIETIDNQVICEGFACMIELYGAGPYMEVFSVDSRCVCSVKLDPKKRIFK